MKMNSGIAFFLTAPENRTRHRSAGARGQRRAVPARGLPPVTGASQFWPLRSKRFEMMVSTKEGLHGTRVQTFSFEVVLRGTNPSCPTGPARPYLANRRTTELNSYARMYSQSAARSSFER